MPFAREYGGLLGNRSFGGAQVSRTFYARGQTGQQLLLGAYQALSRQIEAGTVEMFTRTEMLDVIVHDGRARGIVTRCMKTGKVSPHIADMVVLCTGGYGNVFYLSTNAKGCNCTAAWRAHRHGAAFANPCYTQIHPTCIPQGGSYQSKLTLMSESLRNDGRVWVPRKKEDVTKRPEDIPEADRYYYLEERYPAFGNLVPRDVASRNALYVTNDGLGVGPRSMANDAASISTSRTRSTVSASRRSGSATATSSRCTSASRATAPTRRRCASTRRLTTRWAASGWTTTCRPPSQASSPAGRRTSPTTAQTASAPRR